MKIIKYLYKYKFEIICISVIIISLFIYHNYTPNYNKIAIHTVFILKENILFLEEWINYHILLGFNKFYLYDNSKVTKSGGMHPKSKKFEAGKVNKYNVNYDKIVDMTQKEMDDYVKKLCDKYKFIEIIEWSPKDKDGNILHNQKEAHNDCLNKMKKDNIDWCANIDMDEYIVLKDYDNISQYLLSLPSQVKNIRLGQVRFDSRFNNLDKLVTEITSCEKTDLPREHSNKNIFSVKDTQSCEIHTVVLKDNKEEIKPILNEIWFNHYKLNDNNYKDINNIKIKVDKKSFIPLK